MPVENPQTPEIDTDFEPGGKAAPAEDPVEKSGPSSIENQMASIRSQIEQVRQIATLANLNEQTRQDNNGGDDGVLREEWFDSGAAEFSGKAHYLGTQTTGLASDSSKPWVKLNRSTGAWSQETGPAPQPVPDNEVWREKAGVAGHIYIDR